jgi:hypothetical protein
MKQKYISRYTIRKGLNIRKSMKQRNDLIYKLSQLGFSASCLFQMKKCDIIEFGNDLILFNIIISDNEIKKLLRLVSTMKFKNCSPYLFVSERSDRMTQHSITQRIKKQRKINHNHPKLVYSNSDRLHEHITTIEQSVETSNYFNANPNQNYIYEFYHPITNNLMYVGRGKRGRFHSHITRSSNKMLRLAMKQIIDLGEFPIIKIQLTKTEESAKKVEKKLLDCHGLLNVHKS